MATRFLADLDGSFLLVEPGTILLVEGDFAASAYRTIEVPARRVSAVVMKQATVPVTVSSRRVRVKAL